MESKKQYEEPKMDIVLIEDDPVKAGPFSATRNATDPWVPGASVNPDEEGM